MSNGTLKNVIIMHRKIQALDQTLKELRDLTLNIQV